MTFPISYGKHYQLPIVAASCKRQKPFVDELALVVTLPASTLSVELAHRWHLIFQLHYPMIVLLDALELIPSPTFAFPLCLLHCWSGILMAFGFGELFNTLYCDHSIALPLFRLGSMLIHFLSFNSFRNNFVFLHHSGLRWLLVHNIVVIWGGHNLWDVSNFLVFFHFFKVNLHSESFCLSFSSRTEL